MNEADRLFLNLLKAGIRGQKTEITGISELVFADLYRLMDTHQVLPLITEVLYESEAFPVSGKLKKMAVKQTVRQAERSAEFLELYRYLNEHGLYPTVMKGIVCRKLYPNPEQRRSVDEDLLIRPDEITEYDRLFREYGLKAEDKTDVLNRQETTYTCPEKHLVIELHRYPFATDAAYSELNTLFENRDHVITEKIYTAEVQTMDYSDHILYMFCHAYKHFLYSGIGIRQLCDIALFADSYREQINWQYIMQKCREYRIDLFAVTLLKICRVYLGMRSVPGMEYYPDTDETPLLKDILSGGLYGASDPDRLHSSTITLEAFNAHKEGRRPKGSLKALFPSAGSVQAKYPYIRKHKWLLPVAWVQRAIRYSKDRKEHQLSPVNTIEIGKQRIELLKKYGIID